MSPSAEQERALAIRALFSIAIAAYVGTLVAGGRASEGVEVATYLVVIIASVIAHELAHALVVVAVGGEVRGMRLGFGPRLTAPTARLDLRPLIIAGHVSYQPPRAVRRGQLFAIGVAGIAVHAVLVAVALAAGSGRWPVWRIDVLIANLSALVANAAPTQGSFTTTAGGPNDGAQLVAVLRHRGPLVVASDPDYGMLLDAYSRGGLPGLSAAFATLVRPDVAALRAAVAEVLVARGAWQDAAALATTITPAPPGARGAVAPWLADALYAKAVAMGQLLGAVPVEADLVAAAGLAAERAVAALPVTQEGPTRADVTLTLGLVRLVQHRFAEADAIAAWCLTGAASPAARAQVLAVAGLSRLGMGRRTDAEGLLHQAMSLAPRQPLTQLLSVRFAATPV